MNHRQIRHSSASVMLAHVLLSNRACSRSLARPPWKASSTCVASHTTRRVRSEDIPLRGAPVCEVKTRPGPLRGVFTRSEDIPLRGVQDTLLRGVSSVMRLRVCRVISACERKKRPQSSNLAQAMPV